MTVLVVGGRQDAHVLAVRGRLATLGVESIALDRFHERDMVSLAPGGTYGGYLSAENRTIALETIRTVWWRLKPVHYWTLESDPAELGFITEEWRATLQGLPLYTPGARWINEIESHRAIANKPAQLALARRVGFTIPRTVITNDPAYAEELIASCQSGIYKPLSGTFFPGEQWIFTTLVKTRIIREHSSSIRRAPGIFQERVPKAYELRVTVVGERVFATRINSQRIADTRVDWRRSQLEDMYERHTLMAEDRDRVLAFHQLAGLHYAAYDLIVTPGGDVVFLECNPGGQWLWLEERTEVDITGALAGDLAAQLSP